MTRRLSGVLAAAATPLRSDLDPDLEGLERLLSHLARSGLHGALLLGTTGEGPSFGLAERLAVMEHAAAWRRGSAHAGFLLLGGTGCAALPDTIEATRGAFRAGLDGVVVLPPFYYKGVDDDGLVACFDRIIGAAVPPGGTILLYHIPRVAGVGVPARVLADVVARWPDRRVGVKDSGVDLDHTRALCRLPGPPLVFTGTDSHLPGALAAGAAGSITALANVCGPLVRRVFDARSAGAAEPDAEARLAAARSVLDAFPSVPAVKRLLCDRAGLPLWPVRPPLRMLAAPAAQDLGRRMAGALGEVAEPDTP